MKAALGCVFGILFSAYSFAQGLVNFANSSTSLLATNSLVAPPPGQLPNQTGPTTGVNQYLIGLYIAPQGTTDPNAFTLMGPTTFNQTGIGNGRFNGNPGGGPGTFVISNNTGTIAFQVRAWSAFGGSTFEQAAAYPLAYIGSSAIGFVTPDPSGPNLFGTNPGQVGGFVLVVPLPEPSTNALIFLGLGIGLMFIKRSRQQPR